MWQLVGWWVVPAVLCFIGGGMSEAVGAEGFWQQWLHLVAVVVISLGSLLLMFGLSTACGPAVSLPWLSGGGLSAAGSWYLWLAAAAVGLISIAQGPKP